MKFYTVTAPSGETIACAYSLRGARDAAVAHDGGSYLGYQITRVTCPVNAETIRLLLAEQGGYAAESEEI